MLVIIIIVIRIKVSSSNFFRSDVDIITLRNNYVDYFVLLEKDHQQRWYDFA